MLFLQHPRYYDAPDGQAPFEKVVSMSKKGFVFGLVSGIADCVWKTQTKNAAQTLNCLAYWIVPMVGMSATWATVTYMSTKMRGKDDITNYVIGAASLSPIIHGWKKNLGVTIFLTGSLMIIAGLAKDKQQSGWYAFPDVKQDHGKYVHDFTLTKDGNRDFRSQYPYQA